MRRKHPIRLTGSLALLLLSIGVVAVAVAEVHRAAKSQRVVADRVLREYATFAGWSYQQHVQIALAQITGPVLGSVHMGGGVHEQPPYPLANDLPHYLPWDSACFCHKTEYMPASLFAFTLGADTLGVARNTYRHPERGWLVDTIIEVPELPGAGRPAELLDYTAAERRWIADTLTAEIRGKWRDGWRYALFLGGPADGREYVFAYTIMRTGWGDTIVYGSEYPRETLARMLGDILSEEGLLPAPFTRDHANADLLTVEVTDGANRPLYRSTPEPDWTLEATTPLPEFMAGMRVRTEIRPELAGDLVIGGLPRSRLPFLLTLLAIAATLAAVAVRQLRREQELAQLRGDFVASVSHELRTPLAQIRLFLETLRLGRVTTEAQREWSLGNIDRETTRLAHLVDNVLQFSRGERRAPRLQPGDLTREVRQTVEAFEPLASARRARLLLQLEDGVAALMDAGWFRQVLTNVLDNAVKYGPAGQTVTVTLRRSADRAVVTVEDEGPGVSPEDAAAIWQPFFRGEAARASAAGGSGIGLSIVRELTEAQGGTATVETGDRGGAKFIIALPATAAVRDARQHTVAPAG